MLESTIHHMQNTLDSFWLSIMDTSFDQEKQESHIKIDDLFFDYFDKNNPVERFIKTYREYKAKSTEVLFKNLLEILTHCKDFPKKSGNTSKSLCAEYITQKVNSMLQECDYSTISSYLDESYYSLLTSSSVYSWISGKRSIDRISIFKIAYGLQLPFDNSTVFSYQALFNRVFNQRYCLKRADEIALCYGLEKNIPYINVLQIISNYNQLEKTFLSNLNNEDNKEKTEATRKLLKNALESENSETFTDYLISSIPSFVSDTTAINDELNSRVAVFNDEKIIKTFSKKYDGLKSALTIKELYWSMLEEARDDCDRAQFEKDIETKYPNFYNYVVVSDGIFDNAQKQLELVNYLLLHPEKLELFLNEELLLEENKDALEIEEYYNSVGCPAILQDIDITEDISAQLETIKSDLSLLLEIIEPMHFQKLKPQNKEEEQEDHSKNDKIELNVMNSNQPTSVPRDVFVYFNAKTTTKNSNYYESMRKLIVTISFFNYFNDYINQTYSKSEFQEISDGFVDEINHILAYYNYNELYAYNTFDLFFILCIHTTDPIYTYYLIIRYYVDKYYILNRPDRELDAFIKKYKINKKSKK